MYNLFRAGYVNYALQNRDSYSVKIGRECYTASALRDDQLDLIQFRNFYKQYSMAGTALGLLAGAALCLDFAKAIKSEDDEKALILMCAGAVVGVTTKLLYKRELRLMDESVVMVSDNPYRAKLTSTLQDLTEKGFAVPRFYDTAQPRPD